MDALEAIRTRRSIGKVKPERPPRDLIQQLAELVTLAPNHYLTEPWKVFVLSGKAREELGEVMAEALKARLGPETRKSQLEGLMLAERAKPLRAPVIIVVAARRVEHSKAMWVEDLEAVSAGVQNVLLAAHAMGLGAYLRTGEAAYDDRVKAFFGLDPEDHLAGFVYVGYPDAPPLSVDRAEPAGFIEWRGWQEHEDGQ